MNINTCFTPHLITKTLEFKTRVTTSGKPSCSRIKMIYWRRDYVSKNYVWIYNIERTNQYTLNNNEIYKHRMALMEHDTGRSNDWKSKTQSETLITYRIYNGFQCFGVWHLIMLMNFIYRDYWYQKWLTRYKLTWTLQRKTDLDIA